MYAYVLDHIFEHIIVLWSFTQLCAFSCRQQCTCVQIGKHSTNTVFFSPLYKKPYPHNPVPSAIFFHCMFENEQKFLTGCYGQHISFTIFCLLELKYNNMYCVHFHWIYCALLTSSHLHNSWKLSLGTESLNSTLYTLYIHRQNQDFSEDVSIQQCPCIACKLVGEEIISLLNILHPKLPSFVSSNLA